MKKIFVALSLISLVFISNAQIELTDSNAETKLLVNDDKLILFRFLCHLVWTL